MDCTTVKKFEGIPNKNIIKNLPLDPPIHDFNFLCKYTISSFKREFFCKNMIIKNSIISQYNELILKQSNAIFLKNEEEPPIEINNRQIEKNPSMNQCIIT